QRVAPRAAVLLRGRHPHQPELAELCDEVVREPRLAVELLGHRRDTLLREVADGRADELLLLAEVEVQALSCRASSTISRTPYPVPPRCVRWSPRERSGKPGPAMSMCAHGPWPANSCRNSAASAGDACFKSDEFFMSA